jgi:hypothetical protein
MSVWATTPPLGRVINTNHPLSKDMVACWLLNEGGGNIANDSVSNAKLVGLNSFVFEKKHRGSCGSFGMGYQQK